jgi:cation:H+ antiporter
MEIATAIGLIVIGLALLAGGGEALVRAATTIAEIAGVTPAVIGLTVVAMGTSLPELTVSLFAALNGQPDMAIGNVVGSNIFNVAAALGVTAMIVSLPVHGNAVRLEWPFMFLASLICFLLSRDGVLDRVEGAFFVVSLALFIAYTVRVARRDIGAAEARELAAHVESRDIDAAPGRTKPPRLMVPLAVLAGGLACLILGGRWLVDGASSLARFMGMTERVIALTIVAGGTGAPEMATSLVAAFRGRTDVAVANMIGSNIFNILGILGITALVTSIPVSPVMVHSDMLWMIGVAILLLPLMRSEGRISRLEGGVLVAAYVAYLLTLFRG